MSAPHHSAWPDWPADGLEHLGHCPVCGSHERTLLYKDLTDRLFGAPGRWTMYLCGSCGSGYLDPRPNRETIGLAYANYETHRPATPTDPQGADTRWRTRLRNGYLNTKYGYDMRPASRWGYLAMHLLPPPWRLEWDHYARHLKPPAPGRNRLLDVGCGNGEFLLRARSQGWEVHGLDFDAEALSHARRSGIEVRLGNASPEQFPENHFDAITCHQVIEHVHDVHLFARTLHRWLRPGGSLWIGTPNIAAKLHRQFRENWYPLHPPQHLVIFSCHSLRNLLLGAGFLDINLLPRGYCDSHYHRASRNIEKTRKAPTTNYKSIVEKSKPGAQPLFDLIPELIAWLAPETGSDLTVTARK